jgi:hypothetical protein
MKLTIVWFLCTMILIIIDNYSYQHTHDKDFIIFCTLMFSAILFLLVVLLKLLDKRMKRK